MKDYDKYQIEDALRTIFNGWNERMLKELLEAAYCECKSLQSRLEQAKKDAARYQWLRTEAANKIPKISVGIWGCNGNSHCGRVGSTPCDVDLAIDTAMQSAKESQ